MRVPAILFYPAPCLLPLLSKMADLPTFREWLGAREPTLSLLQEHLRDLGGEWLRTEHKAATEDIDFGLRRAAIGLHNTRGGDVFLGVKKDRTVGNTPVTVDRIRQVLAQGDAKSPNEECITDLNPAITSILPIEGENHRVVVIEVTRTGKAGLLVDENGKLQLCYRRGDETLEADAGGAIDWYRASRREEILVKVYSELRVFTRRVRRWSHLPEFPRPILPYLASCMADGSLYEFLTDDDLLAIIGGSKDPKDAPTTGFVHSYLSVVRQALAFYERQGLEQANTVLEQALQTAGGHVSFGDYQTELANRVKEFREWLLKQGVLVD